MSNLCYEDRRSIGYALYDAGFKPSFSSSICDYLTAGFGKLDSIGEWEYPVECFNYYTNDGTIYDGTIYDCIIPWKSIK